MRRSQNAFICAMLHLFRLGYVADHPFNVGMLPGVFRRRHNVERNDPLCAALNQHLNQPLAHKASAAGDEADLRNDGRVVGVPGTTDGYLEGG
jgi:hypothetical protein